jgi:hypothetical protein
MLPKAALPIPPPGVDLFGFGKDELEDIAVPPVCLEQGMTFRRNPDKGIIDTQRIGGCVEPFLVKYGEWFGKTGIGQTEMNLSRSVHQGLVAPPAAPAQIYIPLVWPAADPVNIVGLTGPRGTGHHQLAELETDGELYAPNQLCFLDRFQDFVEPVFHKDGICV